MKRGIMFGVGMTLFVLAITSGCSKLKIDGHYEAKTEGLLIAFDFPFSDALLQKYFAFREMILKEIGQDPEEGLYKGYVYGKVTLTNNGQEPLQKGFSPPNVIIGLKGRKGPKSEALQVMIDRLVKEAERFGRDVEMEKTENGWHHEFMGEIYNVEPLDKRDAVAGCWLTLWEKFYQYQKQNVPPLTIFRFTISNESQRVLKNSMYAPTYFLEVTSKDGHKAQSSTLAQAIEKLQRDIDEIQAKPEIAKNIPLYNKFALIYNNVQNCLTKATPVRRDEIAPNQQSEEYYIIYGIAPNQIDSIHLKGGTFEGIGQDLYEEVASKVHFPLKPGESVEIYMGFPSFDIENELESIHFSIASLFVELR